MKLRFTPRAARDLAEIADYIREHSPQAAVRVRAAIIESLQSLVLFPHIGRQQKVEGVRHPASGPRARTFGCLATRRADQPTA
jgi:toxin ParE1/3/4